MELKFTNNRKYKLPNPTFRVIQRATELSLEMEEGTFLTGENITTEELANDLEKLADFIVLAFQGQFTKEEFSEGYMCEDLGEFVEMGKNVITEVFFNPKKLERLNKQLEELNSQISSKD